MTIDKEFQAITMWDSVRHIQQKFLGRIRQNEVENLKAYLTPFVYQKDLVKSDREAQVKYMDRIKNWREEHRLKVEGVESESEEEEADFDAGSEEDLNEGDADQKK